MAVVKIVKGLQDKMYIGNMDATRDWGHARDYVEGMWLMLQADQPDDFVIATGISTSVRDFIIKTFRQFYIELDFQGEGINEKAIVKSCGDSTYQLEVGSTVVEVDEWYFRPTEVDHLLGDASKAKELLGWSPKTSLDGLIKEMVDSELDSLNKK
jgi:GDPmannose 4,6-dehydratase